MLAVTAPDEVNSDGAYGLHKSNIMSVDELTNEQLQELRVFYYQQLLETTGDEVLEGITQPNEIPMSDVIAHYEGVYFVNDDFFCSMDL